MSLQKHALQILGAYLFSLIGSAITLTLLSGASALWVITVIDLIAFGLAWAIDRHLVVANDIEAPGVQPAQAQVVWGIGGIALILLGEIVGNFLEGVLFHSVQTTSATAQNLSAIQTAPGYVLTLVIAIPVLEELAFRKVIFGNLAGVTGTFGAALIAALLFALSTNPRHWLTATITGLILAYLYKHTGAISTPIIAHIGVIALTLLYTFIH